MNDQTAGQTSGGAAAAGRVPDSRTASAAMSAGVPAGQEPAGKKPLSPAQAAAVSHGDGPAIVLAGPGSGKTTVIVARVLSLIRDRKVPGGRILVITFSRAAAAEMQTRFLRENDGDSAGVTFGTFHSVFFRILRLAYHYDASNILRPQEQMQICGQQVERFLKNPENLRDLTRQILDEISSIKSNSLPVDRFYSACCPAETFRQIYTAYQEELQHLGKVDFDDILQMTLELLTARPDICAAWQAHYQYILVDEFQDINLVQYQVTRLLAAPQNNLFIVGDDDQSIYRFRGARPEIMLGFEKDYPGAQRYLLNINFRSRPDIVQAAGRLISHNHRRFPKEIRAVRTGSGDVHLCECANVNQENRDIARKILAQKDAGVPFSQIAVLFRTNIGARLLTYTLMRWNVPYRLRDAAPNLFDHWIAQDLLAYLKIAQGDGRRSLWLRVANRPNRYIGRDAFPDADGASANGLIVYYRDKYWMQKKLHELAYDLRAMKRMNPYAAIHYVRNKMQYDEYLKTCAKERHTDPEELIGICNAIHESSRGMASAEEWEQYMRDTAEQLKEQAAADRNAAPYGTAGGSAEEKDAVTIATLHSAKGLEFSTVFIPDLNEDNIPHARASKDADLEEERRLLYVGMTRARDLLYLYTVRASDEQNREPSRFLGEIRTPAAAGQKAAQKPHP